MTGAKNRIVSLNTQAQIFCLAGRIIIILKQRILLKKDESTKTDARHLVLTANHAFSVPQYLRRSSNTLRSNSATLSGSFDWIFVDTLAKGYH